MEMGNVILDYHKSLLVLFDIPLTLLLFYSFRLVREKYLKEPFVLDLGFLCLFTFTLALISVFKASLFLLNGANLFGLICVGYIDLAVIPPVFGILVIRYWKSSTLPVKVLCPVFLAIVPLGIYTSFIEPVNLKVERPTVGVPGGRSLGQEITVGIIADFQASGIGDYEINAVRQLLALKPDVILIAGDMYHGTFKEFAKDEQAYRGLFKEVRAPYGVFLVRGNMDACETLRSIVKDTAIRYLDNEIVHLTIRGRPVTIGGIDLFYDISMSQSVIRRLEEAAGAEDIRILLSHVPDAVSLMAPESRIDLVVSGHTHGGQIRLPFYGPLLTSTRLPRSVAGGGLHQVQGNQLYISRGVGCERGQAPPMRFLCRPEITLLRLVGR